MFENTKDKIAVRNNAGKTTPAETTPMANTYTNPVVLEKIENLAKNPRLIAEKGSTANQRPSTHTARSLRSDGARTQLGRYVATEHAHSSVATQRPSSSQLSTRYVATCMASERSSFAFSFEFSSKRFPFRLNRSFR
ncbi:hypothetical protein F2Q70_00043147 [Brassica cretica]|uniref:Uncharacterized protein n=1 Tax=Brassica cretica TaxID=69181 RepID=A0A8S9KMM0_BRACR|nr:hypothetical protein F2Q70_00043147 [Brassica cretica]